MDGDIQERSTPLKPKSHSKPIQRAPGLWFDDGNNVIQAGNYQFRVHRSILSARSQVLQKVLAAPVPSEGTRTVEGCPVTDLLDNGEDVNNLLLAIYDPAFFEPPPKDIPVDVVLSVARLSHKYEIQYLRRRAILHIEQNYPIDMNTYIYRSNGAQTCKSPWFLGLETMLNIIVTATTVNAPWVLPAVYYHCADTTPSHTFRHSPSWNNPQMMPVLRNVLAGKVELEIMDVAYEELLGAPPSSECRNRERCTLRKLSVARGCRLSTTQDKQSGRKLHTLGFWRNKKWKEEQSKDLCAPCSLACMNAYESARGDYWEKIPSAFCLPSWKELKSLQETDQQLNG